MTVNYMQFARSHHPKIKITLFGSESTGKTTLAEQLASHFHTLWTPEYARIYQEKHNRLLTYHDVTPIAKGQIKLEQYYLSQTQELLICDTDILETKVYSEAYYDKCPEWIVQTIPGCYADLYLFMDIDLPWIPDGIRDRPNDREEMHARFQKELESRRLPFVLLSGNMEDRFIHALKYIEELALH
ncbi:ATP-binding protein [Cytophagaceae bacterium YF14B1]|uniref:ATP-binding protein n=1 Tax=Xanthocytophaga flava TaxID=3048013 RepID=A0AAE3QHP7_9BACT|nr:ATP-binding protein [Xanthocytophaga flavus]MDJ1479025.1 ATP-binding protein [Xanthocytophaga flavus]